MILFSTGIVLTEIEHQCLLHVVPDPAQWLMDALEQKAQSRRDALITQWRPRLFADPAVETLPANPDGLAQMIMARPDYKTRLENDAITGIKLDTHQTERWEARSLGPKRDQVTIFPSGLTIPDTAARCILAYVQGLENWVHGTILGKINKGKKLMIAQYHPIIMADASVTTMPATEDGLITMILARSDYQRLGG